MSPLTRLFLQNKKSLHLAYSRITGGVTGLDPFTNLTELYLQHNYIDSIGDGFELTMNLRLLFLQGNRIKHIDRTSFFHLKKLELLDLSDNLIEDCGRYGRDTFPPHSLSILDLNNNPVSEQSKHRNSAVSSLPKLTILDGSKVTREDGENEATRMFIMVPMLEDDGTEAGEMMLNFDRDSDLWVVADTFCNVNEIEGDGARRELVTMMKREARRVWETIVIDREVTLKKMVETMGLEDDEDDEEKRQEEKDEAKTETDEHEAAVRKNTERAFTAVEVFLTEIEEQPSSKLTEKRAALSDASGARKQKDAEVSKKALDEAQRLLKEKVAMIQREKAEQRRKTKELKASAKKNFLPPPVPQQESKEEGKDEAKVEEEAKGEDVVPVGPMPLGPRGSKKVRADSWAEEDEAAILTAST